MLGFLEHLAADALGLFDSFSPETALDQRGRLIGNGFDGLFLVLADHAHDFEALDRGAKCSSPERT